MAEIVEHPDHYGGDVIYEVIKVEEAWGLTDDHYLGCVIEYISRWKSKGGVTDLKKARWWLDRRIAREENGVDVNGVTITQPPKTIVDDDVSPAEALPNYQTGIYGELDDALKEMGIRRAFNEERDLHEFYDRTEKGWRPICLMRDSDLLYLGVENTLERVRGHEVLRGLIG